MPWDNRQDGIKQGKDKKSAFSVSSTAGIRQHDQMQLEEGRVNFSLQLGDHTPSLTEVRGHRDTLLTGLPLVAFSQSAFQDYLPEMAPLWWVGPSTSILSKCPMDLSTGQSYCFVSSVKTPSSHTCVGLCRVDKSQALQQLSTTTAPLSAPCLPGFELLSGPPPLEGWNPLESYASA